MDPQRRRPSGRAVWKLAKDQHGVVARQQLLELGLSRWAIEHRIRNSRLHPIWRGVYAVGRPQVTRLGRLMAAVLACGPGAVISHRSAGSLWGIREQRSGPIEISVQGATKRRRPGIVVHRRTSMGSGKASVCSGIPVTSPALTLVDLASQLQEGPLETAVNEADKLDLIDPESLRAILERWRGAPGVARLRELLDRRTFTLTDSELERRFLPLARAAGMPRPETRRLVNGFKVDFYWPELGLVVETDGLRYHRTAGQQAKDRRRDQVHTAAGLTTLRFTHAQVAHESDVVVRTLAAIADRLRSGPA